MTDIREHLPAAKKAAWRYWVVGKAKGLLFGELVAAGEDGIMKALRTFDPDRENANLGMWVTWHSRRAVQILVTEAGTVKVPRGTQEYRLKKGAPLHVRVRSLNRPVHKQGVQCDLEYIDVLRATPTDPDVAICAEQVKRQMSPRVLDIFTRIANDETYGQIGEALGVSRQRIQQLVRKEQKRWATELMCAATEATR